MEVCPKWWSFELRNCIVGSSFQTLDISRQRMLYYPIGYIPAGECILYTNCVYVLYILQDEATELMSHRVFIDILRWGV